MSETHTIDALGEPARIPVHHVTTSSDRVLLLVERCSGAVEWYEAQQPCMQLVHLHTGQLSYCNILTERACLICGRLCCQQHGLSVNEHGTLCENCALLSRAQQAALQALRMQLEEYRDAAV